MSSFCGERHGPSGSKECRPRCGVALLTPLLCILIVWSHFRREEDYGCVLGLKGDAMAPRKIFERDGGKLQPPTTR